MFLGGGGINVYLISIPFGINRKASMPSSNNGSNIFVVQNGVVRDHKHILNVNLLVYFEYGILFTRRRLKKTNITILFSIVDFL